MGEQFLRLVLWSMHPEAPAPAGSCEHPLFDLDDDKVEEVHEIAAHLMREAKSTTAEGRVSTPDDAGDFFSFLSRNRGPGEGLPVASLSVDDLRTLIESSWLPSGPSGPELKNCLQQLAAAVCSVREFLAGAAGVPMVERHVWRWGAVVTEDHIARVLAALGLVRHDQAGSPPTPEPLPEQAPAMSESAATYLVGVADESGAAGLTLSPLLRAAAEALRAGHHSMVPTFALSSACGGCGREAALSQAEKVDTGSILPA